MAHSDMSARLKAYWLAGEGAAKIRWGSPNDFYRCVAAVEKAVVDDGKPPLAPPVVSGLCATLHHMATGATPGHAPAELAAKKAEGR